MSGAGKTVGGRIGGVKVSSSVCAEVQHPADSCILRVIHTASPENCNLKNQL